MKRTADGMELEQAQALIREHSDRLGTERVAISGSHGRVLAEDVFSPMDQPPFDRAPVDGFALRASDTAGASENSPASLAVGETLYAGSWPARSVVAGTAARIMTGAPIPPGADCVIRQEDVSSGGGLVRIARPMRPGENYVYAGEDLKAGERVLLEGQCLNYAAVGILSSIGACEAAVYRLPRVALISTGDEIVEPGAPLGPGKIYNSNAFTIGLRLKELGAEVLQRGIVPDEPRALAEAMAGAAEAADLVLTTGGASVGAKDVAMESLELLGADILFKGLRMKPGSPAICGLFGRRLILCLSGNPAAASITFELLGRVALCGLAGNEGLLPVRIRAALKSGFGKPSLGRRFLRGRLVREAEAERIELVGKNSSGVLSSLLECNCLVDIPAGTGALKAGDMVDALMLGAQSFAWRQ
ncbi:MAG: molybdopterin molybdotransferase MoeA [Clostridiales Family XIII bacterium]|jgi:molybdopterin molybdotransferase|nr:molybdopterin molybdotransferase MoeA [Clostridiales Family XIII bacterium]